MKEQTLDQKIDFIFEESKKINGIVERMDIIEFTMKENHQEVTTEIKSLHKKQDAVMRSADKIATLQSKNETEIKATQGLYDTLSKHVGFAQ